LFLRGLEQPPDDPAGVYALRDPCHRGSAVNLPRSAVFALHPQAKRFRNGGRVIGQATREAFSMAANFGIILTGTARPVAESLA
jgi:hypothetical protein